MVRCFFFLIYFLVVKDYELRKSETVRNVPLGLECFISFFLIHIFFSSTLIISLMMSYVRLLSELLILLSTYHVTNHLTCRELRYLMNCNLILIIWKCNTRNIRKYSSASYYILVLGKLFYIYKLIHIDLKPRILIASFLLAPSLNN